MKHGCQTSVLWAWVLGMTVVHYGWPKFLISWGILALALGVAAFVDELAHSIGEL